jgi:hypothetical protein
MTPQQRQPAKRGRRLRPEQIMVIAAAAVALDAVSWAGLRIAGRDDNGGLGNFDEPGLSHVHGLGINPADGSLIVATHFGSFRLASDSGRAERIGKSFQDTMGFTVAGSDHFLGSGHPDLAGAKAGQPSQLGLIESNDAGASWKAISLSGEVDFHGLAFAHDRVYGWDSGTSRFMVSADRHRWETRSTIDMFGFVVDPNEADHIIASGQDGLIESTDGGRTWQQVDGPRLLVLSWDDKAGLWGADGEGAVWHLDGDAWQRAGELGGQPQALLATSDALYAAAWDATETTVILRSDNKGRTWGVRYRD